jgi:hypothetical protein
VTSTTPPPPAAPAGPDWDAITHDVVCPLCDYNLRGLVDPRCPECGAGFDWPAVTDPEKRLHPYLFEHHPERNVRSLVQTLVGTLRPARFWSSLSPTQPLRPRRMRVYWLITTLVAVLAFFGEWARGTKGWLDANTYAFGPRGPYLVPPGESFALPRLLEAAGESWRRDSLVILSFDLLILWLAWPWLMLLSLQVFRASMRRAKVRTGHVLRCIVYSFDVGAWVALLSLAYSAFAIVGSTVVPTAMSSGLTAESFVRGFGFLGVTLVVITWRMTQAYRRYMRFDHAFGTILAAQMITMLLVLNWIGFWANLGR